MGDDILIGDAALARVYKELLQGLDVPFSPMKTHESLTLFEFAKRLFFKGEEITPFPIHALRECSKRFYLLLPTLFAETRRGWAFGEEVAQVVASYYQDVMGFNAKYCKEIYLKSAVIERLMLTIRGAGPAKDVLSSVFRRLGKPVPQDLDEEMSISAIQSVLLDSFIASDPANQKGKDSGAPLGELATVLACGMWDTDDEATMA